MEQAKELYRERRGLPWVESLLQDLRYGIRTLRKTPGFTAVAVITLALGIGANTAIFSAVNAALLRPLPYRDADQLVWVTEIWHKEHDNATVPSPDYVNWKAQGHSFETLAAYDGGGEFNLTGSGKPKRIEGVGVTVNFFDLLGLRPSLGRGFLPQEAAPGGPPVVILSHELWLRQFGGNPKILGNAITLDDQKYSVIGVMPAGFRFPDQEVKPQVFTPFQLPQRVDWYAQTLQEAFVIGRLNPGTTPGIARAELGAINERDFAQVSPPFVRMGRRSVQVQVVPLRIKLVGDIRPALIMLLGAVGFVLLIACANLANLQLVRTGARRQEFAVRAAIGASGARLARQLLTEGALLAVAGGAVGLAAAEGGIRLLRWYAPQSLTEIGAMGVDRTVFAFTLGVTCGATLLFGVLPALAASRPDINETLKCCGTRAAGERGGRRTRKLLATAELALALVLLAGSGLMLRSFVALANVDPGFDPHHILTARLNLPQAKYSTAAQQWNFLEQFLRRLSTLPGVQSVGATSVLPLSGYAGATAVRFEGQASPPAGAAPSVPVAEVTPDYFRTMGIGLMAGRLFDDHDGSHQDYPLIVNRSFARRFFPHQNPVGKRVRVGAPDWPWRTIVGVVGDIRQVEIAQPAEATIYRPYSSPAGDPLAAVEIWFPISVVVRCKGNALALGGPLREQLAGVDSNLPVSDVESMDQRVDSALAAPRFNTTLLGIFAGLALLLAMIGVYGVIAYFVSQRTHEIGIRVALGGLPGTILRLVMADALVIVLLGLAVGLAGALAITRYMSHLLFQIGATDPLTFVVASLGIAGMALAASYIPARRAAKVDPMEALRYE